MRLFQYSKGMAVLAAIFFLSLAPTPARAVTMDVGQVAVIEDGTGLILPAMGFCDNLMYFQCLCLNHAGVAFYFTHPDAFDVLVFFTTKNFGAATNAKMGLNMQWEVKGIGTDVAGFTHYSQAGSQGRLLQAVSIGSVASMPDDPYGLFPGPVFQGVEVVAHEIGHHWMASIGIDLNDGMGVRDILRGYFSDNDTVTQHWSGWFNNPSVMYGGILTDNNDGSFTDINGPRKFTPLDQYLMGLRSAAEVGDMWYVVVGYSLHGNGDYPIGYGVPKPFEGERQDFTMAEVIRANGQRDPAQGPCHLKVAFALVHPLGLPPSEQEIAKVDRYRQALEVWWVGATDGRGSLDTRLDGCGTGTEFCPGTPSKQCPVIDGDAETAETEADPEWVDEPDHTETAEDPESAENDVEPQDEGEAEHAETTGEDTPAETVQDAEDDAPVARKDDGCRQGPDALLWVFLVLLAALGVRRWGNNRSPKAERA